MTKSTNRTYPDGTPVEPLYTKGPQNNPGFRSEPWWTMVQEHLVEKEFKANDWALERLKHGASGLLFYLNEEHYLPRILRDIQLPYINLSLVVEGSGPAVMESLLHHAHSEILAIDQIKGTINIDPVEIAARTGQNNARGAEWNLGALAVGRPGGNPFDVVFGDQEAVVAPKCALEENPNGVRQVAGWNAGSIQSIKRKIVATNGEGRCRRRCPCALGSERRQLCKHCARLGH